MLDKIIIKRYLFILATISAVIRAMLAGSFALGNDEVYYWTYSLYPSLSYFDHPPMVAWLIRIFTFNLTFNYELFVRLAAIVAATVNIFIICSIGKKLRDELTGWYAALLYTASVYCFIISGTFILPDSPQTVFWLAALRLMLDVLPDKELTAVNRKRMLVLGLMLGLGMLSKYTTAFLWAGMIIYLLVRNRKWLTSWQFYVANLIAILLFAPVIIWNIQNSFISFAFHGERVAVAGNLLNISSFLTELAGEVLYTNPVNFIIIVTALVYFLRKKNRGNDSRRFILLLSGLPIILVFLIVSLFRDTLPHWSGPGYLTLIPLAALWLRSHTTKRMPKQLKASLAFLLLLLSISSVQILTGFVKWPGESNDFFRKGEKDISLELYGWRTLTKEFRTIAEQYESEGIMKPNTPIVSYRWFPAANLEYYAARPTGRYVLATGGLNSIHQYAFVNQQHGGFVLNTDAWYITSSRDFMPPAALKPLYYNNVSAPDTITVTRGSKPAYYFFVYRLKNLQTKPANPLRVSTD